MTARLSDADVAQSIADSPWEVAKREAEAYERAMVKPCAYCGMTQAQFGADYCSDFCDVSSSLVDDNS